MENKTDIIIGTSKEILPCNENVGKATPWQNNDDIKYKEKKGSNTIDGENEKDLCISSDDYTKTIKNVKDLDFVDETKAGNKEHIALENEPKPFPGGKTDEKICMYIQKNFVAEGISTKECSSLKQEDKSFHCNLCNKNCRSMESLNKHRKIHTAGKIYSCSLCGEIFSMNYLLKDHMITHNEKCDCVVCGKSFNQQIKLKRHMSIHKRNKSHICNMCNKEFSDKRSKERHMSISCPKLPKNNSVVQHFKTHKGGWPYAYLFKKGNEIKTKQFIDKDFQLHTTDQTFCTSIKDVDMLIKDSENTCSAQSDEETHSEEWQVVGFTTHDSEMINDNAVYDHFKLKDMKMHNKESDLLVQTNEEMYTRKPEPVSSVSTKDETVAKDFISDNKMKIIETYDKDSTSSIPTKRDIKINNKTFIPECRTEGMDSKNPFCPNEMINQAKKEIKMHSGKEDSSSGNNIEHMNDGPIPKPSLKKTKEAQNKNSTSLCHTTNELTASFPGNKESQRSTNNVNKPYVCHLCSKEFPRHDSLRVHIKSHSGQKPFLCSTCGKTCISNQNLQVHILSHTDEKPYKCSTCGKGFKANSSFKVHMQQHSGETPFLCITCGESFSYHRHLQEHMTGHTGTKPHNCATCGKGFMENCELQAHMRMHSGERPYTCNTCGVAFGNKCNFDRHMRTHSNGMKYTCNVCDKQFSRIGVFERHMRKHTDLLGGTTSDYLELKDMKAHNKESDLLVQTTEEVHTNEQEPVSSMKEIEETVAKDFQSEFIKKKFIKIDNKVSTSPIQTKRNTKIYKKIATANYNKEYLNKDPTSNSSIKKTKETQNKKSISPCHATNKELHAQFPGNKESQRSTNNVNKPYVCHLCSKGFSRTDTLRVHIKSHSGQKSFLCSTCGKTFFSNQHLEVHLLSHTDEKPFKCTTCGKGFKASNRLKVHMRQHSGETPYLCITCGESFSYRRHLQEHMTEHTGTKPHNCATCGKGFIENCELQAHMRTHSGERPHSCTICGAAFADKRNLNRHIRRHTDGMKYTCNVCGKKVSRIDALNRHMRNHTDLREKSHLCQLCGKGFYMNQHLINHMKTHNGRN